MPPHPKRSKLNDPSANAAAEMALALALEAAGQIAAPETRNNNDNAEDDIILLNNSENDDATVNGISNKLTATILGFLGYKDIMKSRIVCRKFRDSAKTTMVPWAEYDYKTSYSYSSHCRESQLRIDSLKKYKAMVAMSTALPNLQQLQLCNVGRRKNKYSNGEDPDEGRTAKTANRKTRDIQIISEFRQLRNLTISSTLLNGRYPVFFNFPLLEKLSIDYCDYMKWDLKMLVGLPSLKEFSVTGNEGPLSCASLTGNIKSLRALKNTLEKVHVSVFNSKIEGDFMDLSDFPLLKSLNLRNCSLVTGDMRRIGDNDFPVLNDLDLGKSVVGSKFHQFQRIADVPSVMKAIHRLKQRDPPILPRDKWMSWSLSHDSPEWYASNGERGHPKPPLSIDFVQAGKRAGWRWKSEVGTNSCEINWLDPEPDRENNNFDDYVRELQSIQEDIFCFEGYHQPPSQDEYKRLCEEYYGI